MTLSKGNPPTNLASSANQYDKNTVPFGVARISVIFALHLPLLINQFFTTYKINCIHLLSKSVLEMARVKDYALLVEIFRLFFEKFVIQSFIFH